MLKGLDGNEMIPVEMKKIPNRLMGKRIIAIQKSVPMYGVINSPNTFICSGAKWPVIIKETANKAGITTIPRSIPYNWFMY